ncbi:hypothetical protein EX30DRAFT_160884 [Ascodesmis nigricans]|uniref:RRM domain-containing protein n=1 Tax=Ascodesmis nigricans TaxID=341454 RepID=A0A4S2MRZ7_9PEZI|nr:hypothetical protein EX30DRAFT_160884 [Ascodesmis nigricans]
MLTPSGATVSGSSPPHMQSPTSTLPSWMTDGVGLSRLKAGDLNPTITSSATPRRYTPPSPNTTDLNEFFGPHGIEWNGVRVQRLGPSTTKKEVKAMFLFSQGLEDVRLLRTDPTEKESNFVEAYIRFRTYEHAEEAERFINDREMNGERLVVKVVPRPSPAEIAKMAACMELYGPSDVRSQSPSSDGISTPAANSALSSVGEYTTVTGRSLASPPIGAPGLTNGVGIGRLDTGLGSDIYRTGLNGSSHLENDVFGVNGSLDRLTLNDAANAINGNNVIDNAFAENAFLSRGLRQLDEGSMSDGFGPLGDPMGAALNRPRRQTNPAQPVGSSRFGALPPLATGGINGFTNAGMAPMTAPPVGPPQLTSPLSMNSPANWSAAAGKPFYPNFPITSHPPANPADQNPPCNTLYVGNLPAQTSEDELKALFCRQRGYKRMCFRTKPQGPMCFVEFEDTHYATKALTELYGRALSNSTKGGVRLSFSKNPLGVRSQNNPANPPGTVKSPNAGAIPGAGGVPPLGGFPAPVRAPPGLSTPTARQLPSLTAGSTPDVNGASAPPPPPGLFGAARSAQQATSLNTAFSRNTTGLGAVGGTPTSRLPPGFSAASGTGGYFGAIAGDIRSPIDLRSPVDLRGPGTIGNPPSHAR